MSEAQIKTLVYSLNTFPGSGCGAAMVQTEARTSTNQLVRHQQGVLYGVVVHPEFMQRPSDSLNRLIRMTHHAAAGGYAYTYPCSLQQPDGARQPAPVALLIVNIDDKGNYL
jgi:hypothetical protein